MVIFPLCFYLLFFSGYLFPICFSSPIQLAFFFFFPAYFLFINSDVNLYFRYSSLRIWPHYIFTQVPQREPRCLPWFEREGVGIMEGTVVSCKPPCKASLGSSVIICKIRMGTFNYFWSSFSTSKNILFPPHYKGTTHPGFLAWMTTLKIFSRINTENEAEYSSTW